MIAEANTTPAQRVALAISERVEGLMTEYSIDELLVGAAIASDQLAQTRAHILKIAARLTSAGA